MKKPTRIVLLSLLIIVAGGCAPAAQIDQPTDVPTIIPPQDVQPTATTLTTIQLTDALNRTVEFDVPPQNIVISGRATQLIVNTLYLFPEAKERVAHVEYRSQTATLFLPVVDLHATQKADLERDAGPEQIAPLRPDVVLLKSYMKDDLGDPIEQLGIKVLYLDLETPEAFYSEVEILGELFGNPQRAKEIVEYTTQRVQEVETPLQNLSDDLRPDVLILQYSDKGGEVAFSVPPVDWLQTRIVIGAGGMPVWSDVIASGGWTVVSLEQIAAWNPEMIFIVDYKGNAPEIVAGLSQNEQWQSLPAMAAGKVYAFPCDFLSWDQPDPRWILGQAWLAKMIHPDQFAEVDMLKQTVSFYEQMYDLSVDTIEQQVLPLLSGYELFDPSSE